jgi:hypothetical protein
MSGVDFRFWICFAMLLFKKKFLELIRRGEKTQTVRLWKFRMMKAGQRSYIPGVGYIQITAVDEVALVDLTDEDARLDGFPTADSLRTEIEQLYPQQLAEGNRAFRVRFRLLPEAEQQAAREAKLARKAGKLTTEAQRHGEERSTKSEIRNSKQI